MSDKLWKAMTVVLTALILVSLTLNAYLWPKIEDLEGVTGISEEQIARLRERADHLLNESDSLSDEVSDLEDAIDDLEQRISDLENWRIQQAIDESRRPRLLLGASENLGGDIWRVEVLAVSTTVDLGNWSATLVKDDTWQHMSPLVSGTSGNISFVDLDGVGTLTNGDWFTITCEPDTSYRLIVACGLYGGGRADFTEWRA